MAFRIKICGVTRESDIEPILAAGVDAIGLNFVPTSKRRIDHSTAARLSNAIGSRALRVGVFADASTCEILDRWEALRLDLVQLHGKESPEFFKQLSQDLGSERIVRALAWGDEHTKTRIEFLEFVERENLRPAAILIDSAAGGQFGGTGLSVPWSEVGAWNTRPEGIPLILAGGLTPENVAQAIGSSRADGVDTAGGVETSPGVKDASACHQFAARAEAALGKKIHPK